MLFLIDNNLAIDLDDIHNIHECVLQDTYILVFKQPQDSIIIKKETALKLFEFIKYKYNLHELNELKCVEQKENAQ